jgi:O-antigen/teichoic acid export membrane protein
MKTEPSVPTSLVKANVMRQFSRTVVRNSAFGMAAQLAIKLLSFGFSVLIVRNLGAEDYGQYAAVLAFGAMFVFLADLGLSPFMVREVARQRDEPDGLARANALYGTVLPLRLLLSLLAATLLITTAWLTGRPLVMVGAIALGTLGLIMYGVQGTCDAVLAGFERLDLSAGAKVSYQFVFVIAGTAALLVGFGYYGLIIANLLGIALMTLISWRGVRRLGVRAGRAVARNWPSLLRTSLPFGIIGFTLGLSYKFDSVLLNIFRGDVETGYYNAAYNLVFSAAMLSNVVNTALYPSLTRQAASSPQSLPAIYARALRYLLILALPIAMGACALADEIVPFLFTTTYLPAVPALQIVIWVVPLMFTSEFLGYVVLIAGNERRVAKAVMVSTGLNVGLNLLLVPRFGFLGAAVMTVVTESLLVGQYLWILRAQIRSLNWGTILVRPLLAALVMGGLVLALDSLPLLAKIAVGALSYGGLLLLLGALGKDEIRFVRSLRQRTEAVP